MRTPGKLRRFGARAGDGDEPAPLGGVRLRRLLARLALDAGRAVTAATLVDDVWGEDPPDAAGNALQALVSRLRRAIGPELVDTGAGGYRLLVGTDDVDALRFENLLGAAMAAPDHARRPGRGAGRAGGAARRRAAAGDRGRAAGLRAARRGAAGRRAGGRRPDPGAAGWRARRGPRPAAGVGSSSGAARRATGAPRRASGSPTDPGA